MTETFEDLLPKLRWVQGILNWGIFSELDQFIWENREDYRHLWWDSHWARKMTPEDREAKRHPNRSSRWIPAYILDQRKALVVKLLESVVGTDNYADPETWRIDSCYRCGIAQESRQSFITDFNKCLENADPEGSGFFSYPFDPDEYLAIKNKCWEQVSAERGEKVARSLNPENWTQGSMVTTAGHSYGFCTYCWKQVKSEMDDILKNL